MLQYLVTNKLIHYKQYRFHHKRSTTDLTSVTHNWSKYLLLTFQKSLIILLFQNLFLHWISSSLRITVVVTVPQETFLVPIKLLLIFIDDTLTIYCLQPPGVSTAKPPSNLEQKSHDNVSLWKDLEIIWIWDKHVAVSATFAVKIVNSLLVQFEYSFHIWGLLHLCPEDNKTYWWCSSFIQTSSPCPLRTVGDLSPFYRYVHGFCSQELSSIIRSLPATRSPSALIH